MTGWNWTGERCKIETHPSALEEAGLALDIPPRSSHFVFASSELQGSALGSSRLADDACLLVLGRERHRFQISGHVLIHDESDAAGRRDPHQARPQTLVKATHPLIPATIRKQSESNQRTEGSKLK